MEVSKLRTIQDIPLGGKLYYWWFGRGADTKKKYGPKVEGGLTKLPKAATVDVELPELPKLPKLPNL